MLRALGSPPSWPTLCGRRHRRDDRRVRVAVPRNGAWKRRSGAPTSSDCVAHLTTDHRGGTLQDAVDLPSPVWSEDDTVWRDGALGSDTLSECHRVSSRLRRARRSLQSPLPIAPGPLVIRSTCSGSSASSCLSRSASPAAISHAWPVGGLVQVGPRRAWISWIGVSHDPGASSRIHSSGRSLARWAGSHSAPRQHASDSSSLLATSSTRLR